MARRSRVPQQSAKLVAGGVTVTGVSARPASPSPLAAEGGGHQAFRRWPPGLPALPHAPAPGAGAVLCLSGCSLVPRDARSDRRMWTWLPVSPVAAFCFLMLVTGSCWPYRRPQALGLTCGCRLCWPVAAGGHWPGLTSPPASLSTPESVGPGPALGKLAGGRGRVSAPQFCGCVRWGARGSGLPRAHRPGHGRQGPFEAALAGVGRPGWAARPTFALLSGGGLGP